MRRRGTWLWLWLALLLVPGGVQVFAKAPAWSGDNAAYAAASVRLWNALSSDLTRWAWLLFHGISEKAPGIAWVGEFFVPIGRAIGHVEAGLLLSNLLWQLLTLAFLFFAAANAFGGSLPAIAASLFAAGTPIFIWGSRTYVVEPMQTACVSGIFWAATVAKRWDRRSFAVLAVLLASLLLLSKVASPIYVVAPVFLAGWGLRDRSSPRPLPARPVLRRVVAAGVAALALACLAWYGINFTHWLPFVRWATSAGSQIHGRTLPFLAKLGIWLATLKGDFVPGGGWILWLLPVGLALALRLRPQVRRVRPGDALGAACVCQIGICLVIFSLQANEEFRYAYPLLPPLALGLGWACAQLPRPGFAIALIVGLAFQLNFVRIQDQRRPIDPYSSPRPQPDLSDACLDLLISSGCGRENGRVFLGEGAALDAPKLEFRAAKSAAPPGCDFSFVYDGETAAQAAARVRAERPVLFISLRRDLLKPAEAELSEAVRGFGGAREEWAACPGVEGFRVLP